MHYQTKIQIKDAICNIGRFLYHLLYFADHSPRHNDYAMLRNLVLSLPREVKERYAEECAYIETIPIDKIQTMTFPYPIASGKVEATGIEVHREKGLPYVIHGKKGKLFFPRGTSTPYVAYGYHCLVNEEGLLGSGVLAKSPHCYQDADFKLDDGEVLLDIGCAEAIFSLDNIDKVSKAYLFECMDIWRKPLQYTFAPYSNKVIMINKLVSDKTDEKSTTLMNVVKDEIACDKHFFVKMDIEGWERVVLQGNVDFFTSAKVKLSCCVYHRQDDAHVIDSILKGMGYTTRFSEGYMLTIMNGIHYPYFRHGVIYAQNY